MRSGASGLHYYCAPLVCVSAVIDSLAVVLHIKPKTKRGLYQNLQFFPISSFFDCKERKKESTERKKESTTSEIHRHGRAGKRSCDAARPLRFGACHHRQSISGHKHAAPRVPCLVILLPLGCLLIYCRRLPHLPLPLAVRKLRLGGRSVTSWSTGDSVSVL